MRRRMIFFRMRRYGKIRCMRRRCRSWRFSIKCTVFFLIQRKEENSLVLKRARLPCFCINHYRLNPQRF